MRVMCNPAFAEAFRNFTFPSRRQVLKSTAAAMAGAFVCEATVAAPALAQTESLQDLAGQFGRRKPPRATTFRVKEIITFDPDKPSAAAVAMPGDRRLCARPMRNPTKMGLWLSAIAFLSCPNCICYAESATVIVRPAPIDDVLSNPGMGITTFNRFNGQALNPAMEWSEDGPVTKLAQAPLKPDFPDTTIAYLRWYWNVLEPEKGKFRWDIIDLALEEACAHGQMLAIRIMPYSDKHPLPEWYRKSGARRANKPGDADGAIWQPDFSDALYLKYWGELVAEAGKRYDGNPDLDSVDISSVGYWGEGWSPYMPAFPYQKALIDIWFDAFPRTKLLMNFNEPEALAYGTSRGAGWRLDCLGDMSLEWGHKPHMLDLYPQQVVRAGIQDVWRRRPVSLEVCGTVSKWKKRRFDADYILEQALRWHVTSLNLKSSPIPKDWKPKFENFEKRMGYRFVLRRLEYPRTVAPGSMMPIHMWWFNAGVAPAYANYRLAVQLRSASGKAEVIVPVDVRRWLPGDAIFDGSLHIPETLTEGAYEFRIAMLDPRSGKPAIRLAIEGRDADGWYSEGQIRVASPRPPK